MTSFRAEECGQDGSLTFDEACGQINGMKFGKNGNLAEACAQVLFLQLVLLLFHYYYYYYYYYYIYYG